MHTEGCGCGYQKSFQVSLTLQDGTFLPYKYEGKWLDSKMSTARKRWIKPTQNKKKKFYFFNIHIPMGLKGSTQMKTALLPLFCMELNNEWIMDSKPQLLLLTFSR